MFKLILILFVFIYWGVLSGQTKIIAFKSHSGSDANFQQALRNGLFDIDNSNFGMAPERYVRKAKLDSVIYVSDSVAVMVTSFSCLAVYDWNDSTADNSRWDPGRDTVCHHPLFSMKHQLDSIKKSLRNYYYFRNNVDSVKFIGYDNVRPQIQHYLEDGKKEIMPVSSNVKMPDPFGKDLVLLLGLILGISLVAGMFSWKFIKP